jgi:hypothetical protein
MRLFRKFGTTLYFGLLLYGCAILYTVLFYKERCLGDASWQVFHMLNDGVPVLAHGRWITLFNQLPAAIGTWAGLSLKAVMMLYSIGPLIYSMALFILSLVLIQSEKAAFSILFMTVFSVGSIFFILPDLEKHLFALLFCFSGFYLVLSKWRSFIGIVLLVIMFFFLSHAHPMTWSVLAFLPVFLMCEKKYLEALISGTLGMLFVGVSLVGLDAYQTAELSGRLEEKTSFAAADYLTILPENISLVVVFIMVMIGLIRSKRYSLVLMLSIFTLLYGYVVATRVDLGQVNPYLIPLAGLLSFLVFFLIREQRIGLSGRIVLGLLFILDVGNITSYSTTATSRVRTTEQVIEMAQENSVERAIITEADKPEGFVSSSFLYTESALLSSLVDKSNTTYCVSLSESLEMVNGLKNYLPEDRLEQYFPQVEASDDSLNLIQLVETVYREDYMQEEYLNGEFSMWCYGQVNAYYFGCDTVPFELLEH